MTSRDGRRRLPAMGTLLADPRLADVIGLYGRDTVRVQARRTMAALRRELETGEADDATVARRVERLPNEIAAALGRRFETLHQVINATGVLIHTNLGRVPLPAPVIGELGELLSGYCDLEIDLQSGDRGDRNRLTEELLCELTGAEAALAVNNNAAALTLFLAAVADGGEVLVSRGELVEIGGSFRIPDILAAAGARLVEVGTTNRTYASDYARAISPQTRLLLKVHPSNYRQRGFVAAVTVEDLVDLGREHTLPVLVDEGSGLLRPSTRPQLRGERSLTELVAAGCDAACASGDKLLGGPQAGLLVGRREVIAACRNHPLYRAFRPDRMTLAVLAAVLRRHLAGEALPLDRLWAAEADQRRRLDAFARRLGAAGVGAEIVPADAYLGGGTAPDAPVAGLALALPADSEAATRLRQGTPPVLAYVRGGRLYVDLRTVDEADEAELAAALARAFAP